jgi:CBS-domain-containing membrane protein
MLRTLHIIEDHLRIKGIVMQRDIGVIRKISKVVGTIIEIKMTVLW